MRHSSKPIGQADISVARNCLKLLKAKILTEPPPYFPDITPAESSNYRKAFKPQIKVSAPQKNDYQEQPTSPPKGPKRPQNLGYLDHSGDTGFSIQRRGETEEAESDERVECPDCGRKFNQEAMAKHSRICKKVFMTKRKKFDITAKRAAEGASEVPVKVVGPSARRKPAGKPVR